uniref:SCP domain-containing protein n=1 Tax=Plectus sambesii TaxID=2011161 RepID=A0A914V1J8_9BILA
MRLFFFTAALLFVRSSASTNEVSSLEIVVLRYNSLYTGETATYQNGKYEFRFCQCQAETNRPPTEDSRCVCSKSIAGRAVNEAPASFPLSCIYSPQQPKCLMAEVGPAQWKLSSGTIYVEVSIDGRPISDPAWQAVPLSKSKQRVRLTCPRSQSDCPTCHLCINGAIDLDYVVVFKSFSRVDELRLRDLSDVRPSGVSKKPFWEKTPAKTNYFGAMKSQQQASTKSTWIWQQKQKQAPAASRAVQHPKTNWIASKQQTAGKGATVNRFGIDTRAFRDRIIALHNKYRARHGVGALQQNDTLDRAAEYWANYLAAKQGCLEHQKTGDHFGESIYYYATTEQIDGNDLADASMEGFYEESEGYNYRRYSKYDFFDTGHFTQLVWKTSQRIGVGLGMSHFNGRRRNSCQPGFEGTMAFVVIKYDPPGNVQTEKYYFDNVLPPR